MRETDKRRKEGRRGVQIVFPRAEFRSQDKTSINQIAFLSCASGDRSLGERKGGRERESTVESGQSGLNDFLSPSQASSYFAKGATELISREKKRERERK